MLKIKRRRNPAFTSQAQINSKLYYLWVFNFRNINKETQESGPLQAMSVGVKWIANNRYRTESMMREDAVKKFTDIVSFMYPKADQIVNDYGPVTTGVGRVFV